VSEDRSGAEPRRARPLAEERFLGVERLLGPRDAARLARAAVCVAGLGGVGSWVVESLARTGVGRLVLIDGDVVRPGNLNRQLHALETTIGLPKAEAMARRIAQINPRACVETKIAFLDPEDPEALFPEAVDAVVDAIDHPAAKAALIARCKARGVPVVVSGGAGGRVAPHLVRVSDLAASDHDPLLARVRKLLRRRYGFPRRRSWGIRCVWSPEPMTASSPAASDDSGMLQESQGRVYGTVSFVTGVFGLLCAAETVRLLLDASR